MVKKLISPSCLNNADDVYCCELVCAENLPLCCAFVKGRLWVNSVANSLDFKRRSLSENGLCLHLSRSPNCPVDWWSPHLRTIPLLPRSEWLSRPAVVMRPLKTVGSPTSSDWPPTWYDSSTKPLVLCLYNISLAIIHPWHCTSSIYIQTLVHIPYIMCKSVEHNKHNDYWVCLIVALTYFFRQPKELQLSRYAVELRQWEAAWGQ